MAYTKPFAGKLNTRIQIYRKTTLPNAVGEEIESDVLVCTTYAALDANSGDLVTDEKVHHVVSNTFTIRRRNDVIGLPNLEVWKETIPGDASRIEKYRVQHIKPIERSHLQITCTDYD